MNLKKIFTIITILILLVLIRNIAVSIYTLIQDKGTVTDLQTQLEKENREHTFLSQRLAEVQSKDFIEKEAREKLGLVRDNEYPVFLAPPNLQQESSAYGNTENWKKWMKVFRL